MAETIRVTGRGKVEVVPTSYRVQFRLSVTESTLQAAARALDALNERVLGHIQGMADENLTGDPVGVAFGFSRDVSEREEAPTRRRPGSTTAGTRVRKVASYTLANVYTLAVSSDSLDLADTAASLEKQGALIERVEAVFDERVAEYEALRRAADDARNRAHTLLTFCNGQVGEPITISDSTSGSEDALSPKSMFSTRGLHFPCGPIAVHAYAVFTFAILPGSRPEPQTPDLPGQQELPGLEPVPAAAGQGGDA